ncbi:YifB family Mg chelatase-like AAA ATPase [Leifsonia sp. PS1209]|uniref:YifB family Mg chelatase-like AAA ATPase n=1 Tax=Leifsonia sp. PS1209 TaxID=2724914 RepID=UPI001442B0DB|nr:YifB family Mg chelatase-like AAA ATPase [Leifsonia sp. PS1209]QIZ98552.1 YifB family Mg chelatase-like AAA ATPase [Leifsonia sp. PS1209]
MPLARTYAIALNGVDGNVVEVEADIAAGLPAFSLIGLPDAALGESRKRVTSAAMNAGCPLTPRKLTVNLSPASLRKQGSAFDLAIAVAALAAAGDLSAESAAAAVHLGELGLDGRVRPVPGILPAVIAARAAGFARVLVPAANAEEAALVDGVEVVAVTSLRHAAIHHGSDLEPVDVVPVGAAVVGAPATDPATVRAHPEPDIADVAGNDEAIEALVVAAAGGHHLAMIGPPGAGKTMLATRLPGLLPDLTDEQAIEVTCIRSLTDAGIAGRGSTGDPSSSPRGLIRRPPFESPHHTASAAAIVGGGTTRIVPGAIVRATHGVLFLDEAAEFPPSVLDSLRQPLESGTITIHRATGTATFPARFQLVLASNPCPCGRYGSPDEECTCTPIARRRYLARLSGPLLDRVDIRLAVRRIGLAALRIRSDPEASPAPTTGTASALLRERVVIARATAAARLAGTDWTRNADVSGAWLRTGALRLPRATVGALDRALDRGAITMRGYDRTLRLAWTMADLDGASTPTGHHIGAALFLRRGAA